MQISKWLSLIVVFMMVMPTVQAEGNIGNIYEVKNGETLPEIAATYDTTVEQLKQANGLQTEKLFVGQKLRVPVMYEVQDGDSIQAIAQTHRSSVDAIVKINGLTSSDLYPGQIIKVTPTQLSMQGQHILMTREEFREWLFNQQFNREIKRIQQHHTWLPAYAQFKGNNHFQMLNSMENFHRNEMGWQNIAQNITTFPDGKVAVSRPFEVAPEGSIGKQANVAALSIENIGNFDEGHDTMSTEQKETIAYVTALLCIKFGLTPSIDSITYHHWWDLKTGERVLDKGPDYNVKTCPGTNFFGGNSTTSAQKYFYPYVERKIKEIVSTME